MEKEGSLVILSWQNDVLPVPTTKTEKTTILYVWDLYLFLYV